MNATLFGLEMTKRSKMTILICLPLAACFLFCYLILAVFAGVQKEAVMFPKSGLTESIFDSQNLVYKREEAFSQVNSFHHVPYTIDTVDGIKATIGQANVYKHDPYFFYYSELMKGASLEDALREEITSVLSFSAKAEDTGIEILSEESGFVNGCEAKFFILKLTVKSEGAEKSCYMSLYRLHFDESVYVTDWDILVGCMSSDYSTQGLVELQTLSYISVGSLKFDPNLEKVVEAGK